MSKHEEADSAIQMLNAAVCEFALCGLLLYIAEDLSAVILKVICQLGGSILMLLGLGGLILPYPRRRFKAVLGAVFCSMAGFAVPRFFQIDGILPKLGDVAIGVLSLFAGYLILVDRQVQVFRGE